MDISVAGINLAIDEWNKARDVTPGILTTSISVNMKGRFQGFEKANNSAVMVFKSGPEERRDPDAFAQGLAFKRRTYFNKHMDLKFFQNVSRMTSALRIFPFLSEAKDCEFFDQPAPVVSCGDASGNYMASRELRKSLCEHLSNHVPGGLEISEVHGVGYKLLSSTPLLLIVYAFRGRLNLMLHAKGTLFTRRESEEFMDIMMKNFLNYAHDVPATGMAVGWGDKG